MKTKYPILLVHGIAVKDIFFLKSFGAIDENIKKFGFTVYKSKIDSFASIEDNAAALKEEILEILKKENTDKVNIIAHSKGGLDAKHMILNLEMENHVASLTTLCSPHKGSPIAENILRAPRWILKFIAFWINFWYRLFGDKKPDALKVCEELSTKNSIEEETLRISDKIYCQSYSSKMDRPKDDFVMGIPLIFFHHFKKDAISDGLVGKDSTIFGEYKGEAIDESISHSEIIDFFTSKKKKERIYEFYGRLCIDLAKRGL